ncbi:MAG: DUF1223 domain-containing protein [Acidobacteriales bacterium]|nr:DUF1223 domain-containing protein [Terriglobales bacterium]
MFRGIALQSFFYAAILCAGTFARTQAVAAEGSAGGTKASKPILVELFTSEGCSSCPPVDAFVQRLDTIQPVPGGQVIVLSEHVDYWDHDGWKDPNSSAALTERQNSYEHALGLSTPYTPQMIVDGARELRATNPDVIKKTFDEAMSAPKIPIEISGLSLDSNIVRMHIAASGETDPNNADIYVAVALEKVESKVLRGENGGKDLTHVAVVQQITKVGKLPKGKTFAEDFQLKLKRGIDPKNIRVVAFVQEDGPGRVLGATLRKPAS